jgi:hypothetical protein
MAATWLGSSARGLVSARSALATTLLLGLIAAASVVATANAQDPAAAALIASADPDKNGFLVLPLPQPQPGQTLGQFESLKLQRKNEVNRLLREDLPLDPANRLIIERYFNNYEFRILTQTAPEDLELLPKRRFDLFKLYILTCKHPDTHKLMIDLTLAMMQQIVQNKFHPIVRYNAMIVIGELNEQEVLRVGATPLLPEPYSAALNFMVERVDDQNTPDPIRVAAMVGVLRHLEWEPFRAQDNPIPAGTRTTMIAALTKLAEMKTPPAGRSQEGHEWLRRRAIEALGLASVTTALPNVIDTIDKVLKDTTEPLHLRCAAALAIGRANVPAAQKIDANELTRTLGVLATTTIKSEFDRLTKMNKAEEERRAVYEGTAASGAGPGGEGNIGPRRFGGEGFGPAAQPGGEGIGGPADVFEDPKAYRLEPVRKRLRYQLYCVQTGLGYPLDRAGAPPANPPVRKGSQRIAGTPAEKKAAEDVLIAVNKLAEVIEKNKTDLAMLEKDLTAGAKALDAAVAKLAAPPAAAPAQPNAANPVPAADEDLIGGAVKPKQ